MGCLTWPGKSLQMSSGRGVWDGVQTWFGVYVDRGLRQGLRQTCFGNVVWDEVLRQPNLRHSALCLVSPGDDTYVVFHTTGPASRGTCALNKRFTLKPPLHALDPLSELFVKQQTGC